MSVEQSSPQPSVKVAFLVPSTSNGRNWNNFRETYLNTILLPSITKLTNSFEIDVYIGIDEDDRLYSNISLPEKYDNLNLIWVKLSKEHKGKPTWIWNCLADYAIGYDNHEYLQVCGDDIAFDKRTEWLGLFIKRLKKQNNIGYVSGWSNNDRIPTQFLFHKTHYEIFKWIFPQQIHNWMCDDFIYELYGGSVEDNKKTWGVWLKDYKHLNLGGQPRYTPNNDRRLCNILVRRYKPVLHRLINNMNQTDSKASH
jgi:hypothetical protein